MRKWLIFCTYDLIMRFFCFLFITLSFLVMPNAMADINSHFLNIRSNPKALHAFLKAMPKGGELHYHLAGGAYPEHMLDLAIHEHYCLNPTTYRVIKPTAPCHTLNAIDLSTLSPKKTTYQQTIRAWSMKDFVPGAESGLDHFFASFFKFMPIEADFKPQLLAEIIERAADQHEYYLEIMVLPDNATSATFAYLAKPHRSFAQKQHALLANEAFQNNIKFIQRESTHIINEAHHLLGCDTNPNQPACHITVKFQYYVLREQPLDNVFAQALTGFVASVGSENIVGVNLVQPENGTLSLRDYEAQMRVFNALHQAYPKVHIALHAGELTPNVAPSKDLHSHIRDAMFIGRAERIGHGVDILHENNAEHLLEHMATTPIPVEINLTSNQAILQTAGKAHPLTSYLSHHVPVVLSTDDEGILRTNLTEEYVKAVTEHGLDYPTLKTMNRNALTYSFLPGRSLWADADHGIPVLACKQQTSSSCLAYIKKNQKAALQWELEQALSQFEKEYDH